MTNRSFFFVHDHRLIHFIHLSFLRLYKIILPGQKSTPDAVDTAGPLALQHTLAGRLLEKQTTLPRFQWYPVVRTQNQTDFISG